MTRSPTKISDPSPLGDDEASALFSSWRGAHGVLIAVSGGPDSIALLGLAARWRANGGATPIVAATFDHGLRTGSAREAREVKAFATSLGVPHRTLRWKGDKPTTRLQERARAARSAALAAFAKAKTCDVIALAHHQDDQAETVMMRLAAGSGIDGLGGMRTHAPLDGASEGSRLHRPFLDLPKARLIATCNDRRWPFAEDPSNADPRFARARWRTLASDLSAEGLSAARLGKLAMRAQRVEAALEAVVDDWFSRRSASAGDAARAVDADGWAAAPAEIRLRVLGRLIDRVAPDGAAAPERLERLERLADELAAAVAAGRPLSGNLRGVLVRLDRAGGMSFAPEPPRKRGTRSS